MNYRVRNNTLTKQHKYFQRCVLQWSKSDMFTQYERSMHHFYTKILKSIFWFTWHALIYTRKSDVLHKLQVVYGQMSSTFLTLACTVCLARKLQWVSTYGICMNVVLTTTSHERLRMIWLASLCPQPGTNF